MPDVLSTARGVRAGARNRSRREYVDLVVNGRPLAGLGSAVGDHVPVLVTDPVAGFPSEELGRLLGEVPSPLDDGRVPLFVCPECGDLSCGAVTAVVEHGATTVTWRAFGVQYDYRWSDDEEPLFLFDEVGPYVFDRRAYRAVLDDLRR